MDTVKRSRPELAGQISARATSGHVESRSNTTALAGIAEAMPPSSRTDIASGWSMRATD
jgi:hypothetical protein